MSKDMEKWEISLMECCGGATVADIYGTISHEFDDETPCFKVTRVVLSDGRTLSMEGEHDHPYFPCDRDIKMPSADDDGYPIRGER